MRTHYAEGPGCTADKWQVELACKQTNDFIDSMAILECQSFLLGSSPLISATYTGKRLYRLSHENLALGISMLNIDIAKQNKPIILLG